MSKNMPTTGANPELSNAERKFNRELTRTAKAAFSIHSDRGRIARKRKKYMYLTERKTYTDLIRMVAIYLARKS